MSDKKEEIRKEDLLRKGEDIMARIIEKDEVKRYEILIKEYEKKRKIIIALIVVVSLAVIAFLINYYFNRTLNNYKVIKKVERNDSNTVNYLPYGNNLLKFSRDGVSVIDGVGGLLWNGTYEMKEPRADICGDYVAVADIGNKDLNIFDKKGNMTNLEMRLPIMDVEVASQGVAAVVLDDKDSNYIKVINPETKEELVAKKTYVENDGYPVDISLSNDGKKLVTSYLSVINGVVESKVSFFNFGEVGKSKIDRLVGHFNYNKTIIPEVDFINNNTVCVYGDNQFAIYAMKEIPKEIFTKTFKKEIKSTFSNENYIGFVLKNTEGTNKYQVVVYNLKGKKILEKNVNYEYNQVMISGNEIIFYSNKQWFILKVNGKEKLNYTFPKNISYILPTNHFNKYFLIDQTNIEQIKLIKN